jgi:Holliday junction resolvase
VSKAKLAYAKAKGRDAENKVVEALRERGIYAERRRQTGVEDCGDISGWNGVVVEVKARKATDLSGWLKEAEAEAANATRRFGLPHHPVVVHKRRGTTDAGQWYATLSLDGLLDLIAAVRSGEV